MTRGDRRGDSDRFGTAWEGKGESVTPEPDGPVFGPDVERLVAQALTISQLLRDAGIGPCTLPEGVRQLIIERDGTRAWQPIATAPKDAHLNPVLLYWPYWTQEPVIGRRESADDPAWWTDKWLGEDAADPGPTHWMPLPDPPVGAV